MIQQNGNAESRLNLLHGRRPPPLGPGVFKGIQDSPLLQPVRNGDGVQWFSPRAFGVHQCEVVIIPAQSEIFPPLRRCH